MNAAAPDILAEFDEEADRGVFRRKGKGKGGQGQAEALTSRRVRWQRGCERRDSNPQAPKDTRT